jgi:hypothetical protein
LPGWAQVGVCHFCHGVEIDSWGEFHGLETFVRDVDDRKVRVDAIHDAGCREGVGAGLDEFGCAIAGCVLSDDEDRFHSRNKVHRPTDRWNRVGRARRPVSKIALVGNLKGAKNTEVEMASADHAEAVCMVEVRSAGECGHSRLPCVDEFRFPSVRPGGRTHSEQPVLCVVDELASLRNMGRNEFGDSDSEIDVRAVGDVHRSTLGHLISRPSDHSGRAHG